MTLNPPPRKPDLVNIYFLITLVEISDQVDIAAETVNLGSIPSRVKPKTKKNWRSQLSCLTFSNKRDSVEPPSCVVDRWADGSLTRKAKGYFAVSWPRQLGE